MQDDLTDTGDYFVSFTVANSLLLVSVVAVWITGLDWMRSR